MKKGDKETLLTQSMVQGESVYGEKRVSADVHCILIVERRRKDRIQSLESI